MQSLHCVIRNITCLILAGIFTLILSAPDARAQTYATVRTSSGLIKNDFLLGSLTDSDYGSVTDTSFITDGNYTNAATLTAKCFTGTIAFITLGYAGEVWVQPKFPAALPSGSTAYFRIDLPSSTGLSLDVLDIVGDLTGLFTNNLIVVNAYSGATTTTAGTQVSAAKVKKALVRDTAGNVYIAVTADSSFNSARISLRFNPTLLGVSIASMTMKVYYGVAYSIEDCSGRPAYTDLGTSSGITVSLLDSVVKTPINAIDNSMATSSRIGGSSLLSAGVASTVAQTVYLKAPTATTDQIRVVLATPGTLLNLGIANNIKVAAYLRDSLLSEQSLGSLLSLDLLGLLSNPGGRAVYINPGGSFDRISISYQHLVGLDLIGNGINVYDIRHVPAKPVISKDTAVIYQFTIPVVTAAAVPGDSINWYNPNGSMIGTGTSFPATDTISSAGPYYALAGKASCVNLSDTARLYLKIVPVVHTNPVVGTRGTAYAGRVASAAGAGISGAGFRFALASGSNLPAGMNLSSNGTLSGTPTVTDTMNFTTTIMDTVNNLTAGLHAFNLIIRAPLQLPAMSLPDATGGVAYSVTLPAATGGTGNYTYSIAPGTPLPSGLSFDTATRIVSGTAAPGGPYSIDLIANDDEGRTTTQTYSLLIGAPLPLYLASFSGHMSNDMAMLEWQTLNESHLAAVMLQRSADGTSWSDLYRSPLENSQAETNQYRYMDNMALTTADRLLYRLKIAAVNGQSAYSGIVRISRTLAGAAEGLVLYPNPAKAGMTVNCITPGSTVPAASVTVYNIMGQQVFRGSLIATLDTYMMTPGLYTVVMTDARGQTSTVRLVID